MKANIKDKSESELIDIYLRFSPEKDRLKKKDLAKKKHGDLVKLALSVVPKTKKARGGKTIRDRSLELLCHVDYYEDRGVDPSPENRVTPEHKNARSVGLPYKEIVRRISDEFPACVTSVACLRWYVAHVHAEDDGYTGYKLAQRRPRK